MSPSLEADGWELESAVARHEKHHETFEIPAPEERESLRVGMGVKLLFWLAGEDEMGSYVQCEKMWVVVDEVGDEGYVGVLDNDPLTSDALESGDFVRFGTEHVASIWVPKEDARHPGT